LNIPNVIALAQHNLAMTKPVFRIRTRMDPHHFGKLDPDPDPHQNVKLDPDPDPHQKEKQEPDPHQSEKMEAREGHFGALEGPNLEKSEW
jgi:hypothetical protein